MKKTLVENKFGHGARLHYPIIHRLHRTFRPILAQATVPYDWTKPIQSPNLPIKNQYQSFSCGGQAGAYLLKALRLFYKYDTNPQDLEISAKSVYGPIAYPAPEGGTTSPYLQAQLGARGAELEATVPSQFAGGGCTELFMTDLSWKNSLVEADMATRAGYTPYSVHIDKESMAEAIRNYGGIIIIIRGQNNGTWLSNKPLPPSSSNNNPIWGHFMCAAGTTTEAIDFYQSWGLDVGNQGHQYFDETYINSGAIVDCWALLSDKQIAALPPSMGFWNNLLSHFKFLFGWK